MNKFTMDNLQDIKCLLFTGLDFVKKQFDERTLDQYIAINRETFRELDIPFFMFDEWIRDWREQHESKGQ
jgi:hypothetical protein